MLAIDRPYLKVRAKLLLNVLVCCFRSVVSYKVVEVVDTRYVFKRLESVTVDLFAQLNV